MVDTNKLTLGLAAAVAAVLFLPHSATQAAGAVACDADNGGSPCLPDFARWWWRMILERRATPLPLPTATSTWRS
jgi:hypothetical protein